MKLASIIALMLFAPVCADAQNSRAFEEGKTLAGARNEPAFNAITPSNIQDKIPAYGTAPGETQYYQGGQGALSGPGVAKMQNCATSAPDSDPIKRQECEAINFLARNPQIRPQFNLSKTDPMFTNAKNIGENAEEFLLQFNMDSQGSQTQCVPSIVSSPAVYEVSTCSKLRELSAEQCVMGRAVNIDTDANFKCDQTINAYETVKCRRYSTVTCTGGGVGCAPSGLKTDTVSISGFGRFLLHPNTDGFWNVSAGTITPDGSWMNNYNFSGKFYNVYQSDVYFDITSKNDIITFYLNEILYDDNIAVWLNGHLIYHSTGGIDLVDGCTVTTYDPESGSSLTYFDTMAVWDGRTCNRFLYEGSGIISNYGGVELKDKLIEGRNHVRIKVAVGKNGDAIARFKTKAYCPLSCGIGLDNQCALLEARAK